MNVYLDSEWIVSPDLQGRRFVRLHRGFYLRARGPLALVVTY